MSTGLFLYINISGLLLSYLVGFNSGYEAAYKRGEEVKTKEIERIVNSCQRPNQ